MQGTRERILELATQAEESGLYAADPRLPQDDSQTKSREIPKMIILTFFRFDYCSYL